MPGMDTLITELNARGHNLYLLSNVGNRYSEFRHLIPGIELFEGEYISSEHGVLKPSPLIYEMFCETFDLDPETCIFIDDSAANVEVAQRSGMLGIVFHGDVDKLRHVLDNSPTHIDPQ